MRVTSELKQMLEDSLTAPLRPASVFSSLAQKPAPGYPVMTANLAAFTGASAAITLAHAALTQPAMLKAGLLALALGGLATLLLLVVLSFPGALVLHALSRLCGGSGDFSRSYQIVSISSALACLAAVLNWFPAAWALPVLLGAYVTAAGIQGLHQAPKMRTWAILGTLSLFSLGGQWLVRREIQKYAGPLALMSTASEDLEQIQNALPQKIDLENMALEAPEAESRAVSGMDMIKNPQVSEASAPSEASALPSVENPGQDAAAMMSMIAPMLNNPALLKSMPAEDAAKMKELMEILNKTQASLKSGKPLSEKETKAMAQKIQQLTMEMMQTMTAPGGKPKLKSRRAQP